MSGPLLHWVLLLRSVASKATGRCRLVETASPDKDVSLELPSVSHSSSSLHCVPLSRPDLVSDDEEAFCRYSAMSGEVKLLAYMFVALADSPVRFMTIATARPRLS